MKIKITMVILASLVISCTQKSDNEVKPVEGTWQLITGTLIENGDTIVTDYTKNVSFIKIINDTHFAFLQHDLNKGQDTSAIYVSGGGGYSLNGNVYTEHLEYCSERNWEDNDFSFTISIEADTLIQKGIEKVESAGVNRMNIEKYIRVKE